MIQQEWRKSVHGSPQFKLFAKLKWCSVAMRRWGAQNCTNNRTQIIELKNKNYEVQKEHPLEAKRLLNNQLLEAYKDEEKYWCQKVRVKWLKYGDQNTSFFILLRSRGGEKIELPKYGIHKGNGLRKRR